MHIDRTLSILGDECSPVGQSSPVAALKPPSPLMGGGRDGGDSQRRDLARSNGSRRTID